MSGKIKIALCLSGEPRSSMFCFPYIYESFINLGPDYEVDVFIHTRKNFRAFKLYKPKEFILDNTISFSLIEYLNSLELPSKLQQEKDCYDPYTFVNHNILNQLLMIEGIHKSFTLSKKNSKVYDIYIRCRPDIFTDSFISIHSIIGDILDKKYDIFIPSKHFKINSFDKKNFDKEYMDQFAIGNYKAIECYSNMINNLEYLINTTSSFKAEKWLPTQLNYLDLKINQSYFPLNLIRSLQVNSNRGILGSPDLMFLDQ